MDVARFESLVGRWQDGDATAQELVELEGALRTDPALRRELVDCVLVEVDLYARYAASAGARGARPRRFRWEAAAALLVVAATAFGLVQFLSRPAEPEPRTATGVVELREGSREFVGGVRVQTPSGSVTGLEATFTVALRTPPGWNGKPELNVRVRSGSVRVEAWGLRSTLIAGEERSFGPERAVVDLARLLKGAALTLAEAVRRAQSEASDAVAVSASIEDENGRGRYTVELAQGRRVRELEYDVTSGQRVEDETEDEDRSARSASLKIPLAQGIEAALRSAPGLAVSAEAGPGGIVVGILADGVLREVRVDGATGQVK